MGPVFLPYFVLKCLMWVGNDNWRWNLITFDSVPRTPHKKQWKNHLPTPRFISCHLLTRIAVLIFIKPLECNSDCNICCPGGGGGIGMVIFLMGNVPLSFIILCGRQYSWKMQLWLPAGRFDDSGIGCTVHCILVVYLGHQGLMGVMIV